MKNHIGLDLSSVIGMGVSGPVLACLTASIFAAFKGMFGWEESAYAVIMLFLSAMLATFPTVKSKYSIPLKMAMWPVAAVMIFASAWGSNSGISAGEEAVSSKNETPRIVMAVEPTGESSGRMRSMPLDAPLSPVTMDMHRTNEFHRISWTNQPIMYVSGSTNQSRFHGGFFKRLK